MCIGYCFTVSLIIMAFLDKTIGPLSLAL